MKIRSNAILPIGVHLVDGQKERFAGALEQSRKLEIWRCELGAAINHHNDCSGLIKREPGLTKDFGRNEVGVVGQNAARINDAKQISPPFRFTIQPVSCNARFVANDGTPGPDQTVKQRRLADVRATHNCQ
jgi:hypothetical protein